MSPRNIKLVFLREVRDQLRDRRTLFMVVVLPLLLYPAMGLGMLQMTLLFQEQQRRVVIVGIDQLPESPALLDEQGIRDEWFAGGESDSDKIEVVTDRDTAVADVASETAGPDHSRLGALARALKEAQLPDGSRSAAWEQTRTELDALCRDGQIDVLIVVPDNFASALSQTDRLLAEHKPTTEANRYSGPIVVRNSADEKSAVAARRVAIALQNWEKALLMKRLTQAGLPGDIHAPAKLTTLDLAEETQIAANTWSKLFPALLIIMTVTGAFYPAIDLGAGEKERGTMETLLICPAFRSEIVLGKFLTVMLFSSCTALLNLTSMGITGQYMVSVVAARTSALGAITFPPLSVLFWLCALLIPIAALFSAICLGLATFAKSSKEGQYYLTPLLMITLGLTVFCLSPSAEITPFYSVLPVVNVALLLKGLLLAASDAHGLYGYILPVLISSACYSLLAIWWAVEQFGSESVLFRAAERVSPRLWLKSLLEDKQPTPGFNQAILCFVLIMYLQFAAMRFMQPGPGTDQGTAMLQMLLFQQFAIIAGSALAMTFLCASSFRKTLSLRFPSLGWIPAAAILALMLHPLTFELSVALKGRFFPELPSKLTESLGVLTNNQQSLWVLLGVFALAPAICEEIAFRGFVLSGLRRTGRTGLAIIGSSLAFGIMHMIPQQVFNASLVGLVLGLFAVRSRSLVPCITFHFVYNSLGILHTAQGNRVLTHDALGMFFRHENQVLRYNPLLLLLCSIGSLAIIRSLIIAPKHGTDAGKEHAQNAPEFV